MPDEEDITTNIILYSTLIIITFVYLFKNFKYSLDKHDTLTTILYAIPLVVLLYIVYMIVNMMYLFVMAGKGHADSLEKQRNKDKQDSLS